MDKVETTKELADFISYNKEDISTLKRDYPEVSDVFGNLLLAIDKKYGSGDLTKEDFDKASVLPSIVPINVGDLYKNPKGEVYEIISINGDSYDGGSDTVNVRNVKTDKQYNPYKLDIFRWVESGEWTITEGVIGNAVLKVDDKVNLPATKKLEPINVNSVLPNGNMVNSVYNARKNDQDFLYVRGVKKGAFGRGTIYVLWNDLTYGGDEFLAQEVEPYTGISTISATQALGNKGTKRDQDLAANKLVGKTYVTPKGEKYPIIRVLVKGPANISFRSKDPRGNDINIRLGRGVVVGLVNGEKTPKGNYIEEFQTNSTTQQAPPKSSNPITTPNFKVGDVFVIPKDTTKGAQTYVITKIQDQRVSVAWNDEKGYHEVETYTVSGVNASFVGAIWIKTPGSKATQTSASQSTGYNSPWRPDWKSKGFRTGPQRSGSNSQQGEYGMGYDGSIWQVTKDSAGVQKWSRQKSMNPIAPNNLAMLQPDDLLVLLDQKNYEISTIDSKIMKSEYDDAIREKQLILAEIEKR